jgi:hypothetical protein
VLAVRFDGELLDWADYCRDHALGLALGGSWVPIQVDPDHLGDLLDQCYMKRCDCIPKKLDRCARCSRLADVWLVARSDANIGELDRGLCLCGLCVQIELGTGVLPQELRLELDADLEVDEALS